MPFNNNNNNISYLYETFFVVSRRKTNIIIKSSYFVRFLQYKMMLATSTVARVMKGALKRINSHKY